jgi:hypothetical protein
MTHVARPFVAVPDTKPLGRKAYGSIGHLPGSKLGPGDHHIGEDQAALLTHRVNPQHHKARVVVQQKIDGACVAVAKINGVIVPLGRAGYPAATAPYQHVRDFAAWAMDREDKFAALLGEGERVVGEWLGAQHAIPYMTRSNAAKWVAFDLMLGGVRALHDVTAHRIGAVGLVAAHTVHVGAPVSVADAWARRREWPDFPVLACGVEPEGIVYRYEHKGMVKFLGKWVRPDFEGRVPEGGDLRGDPAELLGAMAISLATGGEP